MAEDFGPNGALQGIVSTNYSLPRDEQGNLTIPSQAAADYLDAEPKLEAHDKTMRQKAVDYSADVMIGLGMEPYNAYKYSRKFLGDENAPNIASSIGLADITPAGLVFGADEAVRDYGKAESGLDYIAPTVGLGLSALEAFPLTKFMTKPVRSFISSLGKKIDLVEPVDVESL
jgi:hypothetical protein